jgi:hypothetical protein
LRGQKRSIINYRFLFNPHLEFSLPLFQSYLIKHAFQLLKLDLLQV